MKTKKAKTVAGSVCAGALLLLCYVVPAYAAGGLLIAFAKAILTLIGAV